MMAVGFISYPVIFIVTFCSKSMLAAQPTICRQSYSFSFTFTPFSAEKSHNGNKSAFGRNQKAGARRVSASAF
jgi:hypothetical protein